MHRERSYSTSVNLAHAATVVLLAGTVLFFVVSIPAVVRGDSPFPSFTAHAPLDRRALPRGLRVEPGRATFTIVRPTEGQQRLHVIGDLLPSILAAAILVALLGITRSVRDGDPFSFANVRRLRAIGLLVFFGSFAVSGAQRLIENEIARPFLLGDNASGPGLRMDGGIELQLTPLLVGLGAFVLSQVFAQGVRLREDVDATI